MPASDAGSVLRESLYGNLAGQEKTAASVKTQSHLTKRLKDATDDDKKRGFKDASKKKKKKKKKKGKEKI